MKLSNKYVNIDGTQKISESYNNINIGFDNVEKDVNEIRQVAATANERVDNIITTQDGQTPVEVLDMRYDPLSGQTYENAAQRVNSISSSLADMASKQISVSQEYPTETSANQIIYKIVN